MVIKVVLRSRVASMHGHIKPSLVESKSEKAAALESKWNMCLRLFRCEYQGDLYYYNGYEVILEFYDWDKKQGLLTLTFSEKEGEK